MEMAHAVAREVAAHKKTQERKVILGASLGTVFEWYDFYLYGALAPIIATKFFSGLPGSTAFVFALLAFAAGFAVRPLGALVFGRLGDMIGRKHTFLVTLLVMGLSTSIVGVLPDAATVGVVAPVMLVGLRMLQGLALGGEYGGAVVYVAEHAPPGRRGAHTAWVQTTATLGLLLSLGMVLATRMAIGDAAFDAWGWRLPFLASILLLAISVWIRLSMNESPVFKRMKEEGRTSQAPLAESFCRPKNLRLVGLALFGLVAGQAVVWYTSQIYVLFFLTQALRVDEVSATVMMAVALVIGAPFFVVFGALSDRIGRKPIIMAGCLIAALSYLPLFEALTAAANPGLAAAQAGNKVVVQADPAECSIQFNPIGTAKFTSSCDIAKQLLAAGAVSYENAVGAAGLPATIRVGESVIQGYASKGLHADELKRRDTEFRKRVADSLEAAGYPARADPQKMNKPLVVAILVIMVILGAMVYGPMAAMLVELFPTRIRYTSMSLPYHLGNGWFGGLLPASAFAIVAQTGNMYSGLWYPVVIAGLTFVVGMLFVPETKDVDISAQD